MSYSVLNLKQDLTGALHGTTLNEVTNLDGVINRAAREVLQDLDPMETQRIAQFTTPIFEGVYSYYLNPDVKGNAVIDIRPQTLRLPNDVYNQDYSQEFNRARNTTLANQFNIQWNTGVRTILVNSPQITTGVIVNSASNTTLNGTWTVGGNASNLTNNTVNFLYGGGSLQFDLAAGGAGSTGYLENSTMTAVNLSTFLNQSYWFLFTFLPTASNFSKVNLRFGSSSSNYYSVDATVTQANTVFENGWNQLGYHWNNLTTVGSPNSSAITYIRVTWTYDGTAQTGVLLNDISCLEGRIMEYVYYSKYLFRDAITGAFQETVTDDSNLINLDTDSYNVLFYQTGLMIAQQAQGENAIRFDAPYFTGQYQKAIMSYKNKYKSERQKPKQPYYIIVPGGYNGYLPRRWG